MGWGGDLFFNFNFGQRILKSKTIRTTVTMSLLPQGGAEFILSAYILMFLAVLVSMQLEDLL